MARGMVTINKILHRGMNLARNMPRLIVLLLTFVSTLLVIYQMTGDGHHSTTIHIGRESKASLSRRSYGIFNTFYRQLRKAEAIAIHDPASLKHNYSATASRVIKASDEKYFQLIMAHIPNAQTVFLVLNKTEIESLFRMSYYLPSSDNCSALASACSNSPRLQTASLSWNKFSDLFPPKFPLLNENRITLTYAHILTDVVVSDNDDMISNGVRVIPQHCKKNDDLRISGLHHSIPVHSHVFTIAQYWGSGFFHSTIECLPRIMLYLPYLLENTHIKIHANGNHNFLQLLGIDPDRVITGLVRAEVLYVPVGSGCGRLSHLGGQLLYSALQRSINKLHRQTALSSTATPHNSHHRMSMILRPIPVLKQNNIVLIKRSKKRWFNHHNVIYTMLQTYEQTLGITVMIYPDDPVPGIAETVDIFGQALIVIAPHGAGAANLLLSPPGTVLIEGLCRSEVGPEINFCYRNMARVLGMRYHAMVYKKNCFEITPEQIEKPLRQYLELFGYNINLFDTSLNR